ncbi:MAG: prenyltransferase, partial [Mycobacterium leprae]
MKRNKLAIWFEIMRPFSWTAAAIPVAVGSALAWAQGHFRADLFLLTLIGSILLQAGTNVINEIYDLREGVDTLETPRASKVLVQGRLTEREAYTGALVIFAVALAIGFYLAHRVSPWLYPLTALGVLGGYFYTGKPVAYKYHALGIPLVFFLMGPFMVWGAYIVQTGVVTWTGGLLALPVASLVSAILHANDLR